MLEKQEKLDVAQVWPKYKSVISNTVLRSIKFENDNDEKADLY